MNAENPQSTSRLSLWIAGLSLIISCVSPLVAWKLGAKQNRIAEKSARASQAALLTPCDSLFATSKPGFLSDTAFSSKDLLDVLEYHMTPTLDIELCLWLRNENALPCRIIFVGVLESWSTDKLIWDHLVNGEMSQVNELEPERSRSIRPNDSTKVCEVFPVSIPDSSGVTNIHLMYIVMSPLGRLSETYMWIEVASDFAKVLRTGLASDLIPLPEKVEHLKGVIKIVIPRSRTQAVLRHYECKVFTEEDDDAIGKFMKKASKDTTIWGTDVRRFRTASGK